MSSIDINLDNLVDVFPERHSKGSLSIHPYFGKLDPALARALIERFSHPGNIVLDPFCGSGTVLFEAILARRTAVGWDSSPLAILLSKAKLLGLKEVEKNELMLLRQDLDLYSEKQPPLLKKTIPTDLGRVPAMPRVRDVNSWFEPHALSELSFLKYYLAKKKKKMSPAAEILATVAFSRIIVSASNQQGESSYRRIEKVTYPGRVISLYTDALSKVIAGADKFQELISEFEFSDRRSFRQDEYYSEIRWKESGAVLYMHDTRSGKSPMKPDKPLADLVVSSPPYLMSWDYGLYHKFRFYWLGYDLDKYEETEIGRHLRRKKDDVENYIENMTGAFRSMDNALKKDAYIILVNAPSIVYGKEVNTNQLLEDCAKTAGWKMVKCIQSLDIPGPHHGMYASLNSRKAKAPGKSGKKEHVLIFQRLHH